MTLTDQDRRDRIDAAAATLDDIGMPTLATRLRETADELLPTEPARTPGQIAYEAWVAGLAGLSDWDDVGDKTDWESAAAAVIAHHEQQQAELDVDAAPAPRFAVGDRVRIVKAERESGNTSLFYADLTGMTGTVIESRLGVPDEDGDYRVETDNGNWAYVGGSNLEPASTDTDTPAAPAWSPVVGGWAEHRDWGRVLVVESNMYRDEYLCAYADKVARSVAWADAADLSAPVPRVWESAEDVPAHVVVRDRGGDVADRLPGDGGITFDAHGPWTEVLPVGGVW